MALLLFVGGARLGHFVLLGALAIPAMWAWVDRFAYVVNRLQAFANPAVLQEISYQQKQSLIAVGSGGLFGRGLGQGMQQFGFLTFPYSDFIGAILAEELGFVGLAAVTIGFAVYALLGFRIARKARSQFLKLVAVGLTFTTVLTAYLHLGVVVGLLPTTGLTLPFISYGRSNLVLTMLATGLLVNIGSSRERVVGDRATDPMQRPG
jgi:cell division protein FtsW